VIEAGSFLALGPVLTAMQTGDPLFLGFGPAGERGLSVVAPAVSLAGFAVGAVTGARFESRMERGGHRWFMVSPAVESVLPAVTGAAA
jgi:uncharacterized membrane protein YoaK (UPF0700 family)